MSLLRWPRRSLLYVKEVQAEHHELARMAEAQPVFYKSSRRRYFRERIHAKGCICWDIVNYSGHFCRFDASLLLRLQRALPTGGTLPGALPQALYFCAYSARCLRDYPHNGWNGYGK